MADDEEPYALVMPFVVCRSQGGPNDDKSFVSGYECGYLDAMLGKERPVEERRYVLPESLPQVDLIAMRHGYQVESEPWDEHPDESVLVTLTRQQ